MAEWEWVLARESSSKSMSHPSVLPDAPTTYGGRYTNDDEEPTTEYSFRAEGVPEDYLPTIRAAYRARKTKWPLTDKRGISYNGYVTGYDFSNVSGCDRYTVEIQYREILTELTD